jgi:hypothetical protein
MRSRRDGPRTATALAAIKFDVLDLDMGDER